MFGSNVQHPRTASTALAPQWLCPDRSDIVRPIDAIMHNAVLTAHRFGRSVRLPKRSAGKQAGSFTLLRTCISPGAEGDEGVRSP